MYAVNEISANLRLSAKQLSPLRGTESIFASFAAICRHLVRARGAGGEASLQIKFRVSPPSRREGGQGDGAKDLCKNPAVGFPQKSNLSFNETSPQLSRAPGTPPLTVTGAQEPLPRQFLLCSVPKALEKLRKMRYNRWYGVKNRISRRFLR